jgi:hypothetical protein
VSAAVIDNGLVTLSDAPGLAEYVIVEGAGELRLGQNLQSTNLRIRDAGTLSAGATTGAATVSGDLDQSGGIIRFDIQGTGAGQFDQLTVVDDATLNGVLQVVTTPAYAGPAIRGTSNDFSLLTADVLSGTPLAVIYNSLGLTLNTPSYAGVTGAGLDGLFATMEMTGDALVLTNYLAMPGDANGDGLVNGQDFSVWNRHKFTSGSNWSRADFNGDGVTDGTDFNIWNAARVATGQSTIVVVPEPGSAMTLCSLMWMAIALRRRYR